LPHDGRQVEPVPAWVGPSQGVWGTARKIEAARVRPAESSGGRPLRGRGFLDVALDTHINAGKVSRDVINLSTSGGVSRAAAFLTLTCSVSGKTKIKISFRSG
jgi:hypothetical protein